MTTPSPEQYNLNAPTPNDFLATSQGNFLTNFQQLYDAFARNHVALDDATNAGNHKVIELLEQTKGFETNFGELSIYSKDVEGQTDQLFMRYQGDSTEVQITNYQIYALPPQDFQVSYFTFLPGKIIVYFGTSFPYVLNPPRVYFNPFVAKNIITMNFCPVGITPSVSPTVALVKGIPNSEIWTDAHLFDTATNFSYFYVVVANI